ncbi:MAG: hypothetical protein L0L71_05445, partial [Lactococcus sp.]
INTPQNDIIPLASTAKPNFNSFLFCNWITFRSFNFKSFEKNKNRGISISRNRLYFGIVQFICKRLPSIDACQMLSVRLIPY